MTKRFTTDNGSNEDVCLVDNVTGNEYESNFEDIVELLNELHEEKEQLQSRINDYDVALKTLQDLTERKLKENEQLKQQLNRLKRINEVKRETIKFHVDGYNRLKQTILEAYETERTELGKSVLKQLLEQLQ